MKKVMEIRGGSVVTGPRGVYVVDWDHVNTDDQYALETAQDLLRIYCMSEHDMDTIAPTPASKVFLHELITTLIVKIAEVHHGKD